MVVASLAIILRVAVSVKSGSSAEKSARGSKSPAHLRQLGGDDKLAQTPLALSRVALFRDVIPSWPLRNRDDVIELSQDVDGVHKRLDPLPRQSTPFPFGERGGPLGLVLERAGFVGGTGRGAFLEPREGRDDRVAVGGSRRTGEEVLFLSQGVVRGERLPQRGRQDARSVDFEKPVVDEDDGTRASAAREPKDRL